MAGIFPTLPGLGWSPIKRPIWSTRIQTAVNGKELRQPNWSFPIYEFDLTFEFLHAGAEQELQTLMGFFLQQQGAYAGFLFTDPTDCTAIGQQIGVGDGATTVFTAVRDLGGWVEPVGAVGNLVALVGGQPANCWVQNFNQVAFQTPPPAGAAITASFSFSFVCRFKDDQNDFENFQYQLWSLQKTTLKTFR